MPKRCRACAGCAQAKRGKTIAKIAGGLTAYAGGAFLTLTSRPDQTWPGLMKEWSHMVRWLRRTSPGLLYAAVKEEGSNSGMKHLHVVLVNMNFTPQAEISAEWARLTGAWIVDIQRIEGSQAAGYVAKYVAKDMGELRKHTTYSRGWPALPKSELHALPVPPAPPYGPPGPLTWASAGGLIAFLAVGCEHFGQATQLTERQHWWLKSLTDRW